MACGLSSLLLLGGGKVEERVVRPLKRAKELFAPKGAKELFVPVGTKE